MKNALIILLTAILSLSCSLFSAKVFKPSEYLSTTGVAEPGQETVIALDDGAAVTIPANSIDEEVTVTIERNPEKAKSLPPLGDDVVQLGDFYNFDISGGTLIDGVDLVLPLDESRIPDKDGLLTVAIPTENGWEFIPVDAKDGKVIINTVNIGDPLIAWHFVPAEGRIDMSYEIEKLAVCGQHIPLELTPSSGPAGTEIKIKGHVLPVRQGVPRWQKNWGDLLNLKTASNVSVTLLFGSNYINGEYGSTKVTTNEDGSFEATYKVNRESGGVYVAAKAQCAKWFGTMPVPSEGRIYFQLTKSQASQPTNPQATETPIAVQPTIQPIPAGAVLLPDFVGQPIDDAINWLESNGFKYTWIDGSGTYDLGMVYNQAPAGNQYKVPHRTVVVLHRTVEKIEATIELVQTSTTVAQSDDSRYGCDNQQLTAEERANCGEHRYVSSVESFGADGCPSSGKESSMANTFPFVGPTGTFVKIGTNKYGNYPSSNPPYYYQILIFTSTGLVDESYTSLGNPQCRITWTSIE